MSWLNDWTHVEVRNALGSWVDVTVYVRPTRTAVQSSRGRDSELDRPGVPGGLTMGLDNASGIFTPGRPEAALQITLGMPVRVFDVIGYRKFVWFTGTFEMPDTAEDLAGVDNLITVTAVDAKQLLDNSRTFVSTLAEYVIATHAGTLRHYYPLHEAAAPFLDVVGPGLPFVAQQVWSSLSEPSTAAPTITPGGGDPAPGDDLQGLALVPTTNSAAGFGFPTMARAWRLRAEFPAELTSTVFAAGVPLTVIVWVDITEPWDLQRIIDLQFRDVAGTQSSSMALQRILNHSTSGADAGLLSALAFGDFAGSAESTAMLWTTGTVIPIGVQITHGPNTLRLWAAGSEYVASAPSGAMGSPQQLYQVIDLGDLQGTIAHFQIHVGAFSRTDFLAQYEAGLQGLASQRTDERVASILSYAGNPPAVLDEGSTWMQATGLAGRKAGDLIDDAVSTERGRMFVDGDGILRFHSRVRAYNL